MYIYIYSFFWHHEYPLYPHLPLAGVAIPFMSQRLPLYNGDIGVNGDIMGTCMGITLINMSRVSTYRTKWKMTRKIIVLDMECTTNEQNYDSGFYIYIYTIIYILICLYLHM